MADQKINALPTKTAPVTGDKCLMSGAAEEYLIDYDKLATAILNKLTSKTFTLDQGTKTLIAAINELNSKSFSRITKNSEITINIPKSKAFFVIAGRSVDNAGKNIYAGSSNASGIYSFYKIAGLDEQITKSNDKETITFTSNAWMEVIYVFV